MQHKCFARSPPSLAPLQSAGGRYASIRFDRTHPPSLTLLSSIVRLESSPAAPRFTALPPLALYIHIPWCVRKCPYCDFNSHALKGDLPERRYVDALLTDLESALPSIWGRKFMSIFFGGGTPSLF
jgi:coproporphyrinogen III oxidase-like Fe-S oxidoreductase